jgi:hypothetical protein
MCIEPRSEPWDIGVSWDFVMAVADDDKVEFSKRGGCR